LCGNYREPAVADHLLPYPLTEKTVHLCVDMQRIFSTEGPWSTPWMERVLPVVVEIARRHPEPTVFTRFITPERPQDMPGMWQHYIITGSETDVCVLATVLDAVDLGYRVIVVTDAVCSSSDEGHDALLEVYHRRYTEQIETAQAETVLARWS
jgi:nicotinamidase-related amidase